MDKNENLCSRQVNIQNQRVQVGQDKFFKTIWTEPVLLIKSYAWQNVRSWASVLPLTSF